MKYEITLTSDYGYFGEGVAHLDDGRTLSLLSCLHTATYGRDSVLIDDEEYFYRSRFPLRWFVKEGALDFYSVDKETPDVLLHNESGRDLRIDDFGVLRNGESMEIQLWTEGRP